MADAVNLERQDYPVGDKWPSFGQAVQVTKMPTTTKQWYDFESITVSSTSIGLTYSLAHNGNKAIISVEGAQVRYRMDGADPTAAVGHLLNPGDIIELDTKLELNRIKFIRVTTDATLRISYGSVS